MEGFGLPMRPNAPELMWTKVDTFVVSRRVDLGPCWNWVGTLGVGGYGQMRIKCSYQRTHRISWFLTHGEWPILCVCHKCDNRRCVNPDHLFLGTGADNVADKVAKTRQARGSAHGRSKLTEEIVLDIRRNGRPVPDLAREYGVPVECIRHARKGITWKHLPGAVR